MHLDKPTIAQDLDECPEKIAEAAEEDIKAWIVFKNAAIKRRTRFNKKYLEILTDTAGKKKKAQPVIKIEAENAMFKEDLKLVRREAKWKRKQNGKELQRDRFSSAKYRTKLVTNDYGGDV